MMTVSVSSFAHRLHLSGQHHCCYLRRRHRHALSDGDLLTLAELAETGNAYLITITDTSVDARCSPTPSMAKPLPW